MIPDVLIVGAGSAGCVLAARLSEDQNRSVLFLDAGPDYGDELNRWPADLVNANTLVTSHDWGFRSEPVTLGHPLPLFRGKVVGGSSATNNVIALRGQPADYDDWAEAGNPGWSFKEILPFFRNLENDLDIDDQWHGTAGPTPIHRSPFEEIIPLHRAFLDSAQNAGHPWVEDHNAPDATGVGRLPENSVNGIRQSSAFNYLAPARKRKNLTIRANALVDRLEIKQHRATGVGLADSSEVIPAKDIILAAGTYGSPAILLRSGIGSAQHLRDLGLPVICDLPGVGSNLQDHPLLWLQYGAHVEPQPPGHSIRQAMLTAKSSEGRSGLDLHVFPSGPSACERGVCLKLLVGLMHPASRGSLSLVETAPGIPPRIDLGLLTHPDDLPRLYAGMCIAREIAATQPLADYLDDEQWPGQQVQSMDELAAAIRGTTNSFSSYQHGVGTCRMGPSADPHAVVNGAGAVHGIDHLHVIDASIMPTIPAANTNLPTLMLAEKLASAWILAEGHWCEDSLVQGAR